jgi:GNAT superfamily N-acetyltransferase
MPEDASIRDAQVADCDRLGLITVSASHSAFVGAIPEASLDFSWTPEQSAKGWRTSFARYTDRSQAFRVLESCGEVIGFAWSAPWADIEGYDASVRGLYVLPTCQRQGFGRLLLSDAAMILQRHGARSVEIGCVKENPNCGFYLSLGGIEVGRRPARVDAFQTEEILFGWPDISVLMGLRRP